jgi:two-component system invasion response regulator UvrY
MLHILLTDDHAIVRKGLKDVLVEGLGQVEVGEAATGREALEAVRKQAWDAVVLDINLPDKNGIEVLKEMKVLRPSMPVVVLSLHPEDQYAVRMLKAGAAGYLTKESAPEQLVSAVRKALAGGKYVSASLAEQLAAGLGTPAAEPLATLSDREMEVLCLIARGKTPTDIADSLSLSVKTVSTYRARLLEKLHLKTTADLIRYALDHKLVE